MQKKAVEIMSSSGGECVGGGNGVDENSGCAGKPKRDKTRAISRFAGGKRESKARTIQTELGGVRQKKGQHKGIGRGGKKENRTGLSDMGGVNPEFGRGKVNTASPEQLGREKGWRGEDRMERKPVENGDEVGNPKKKPTTALPVQSQTTYRRKLVNALPVGWPIRVPQKKIPRC